jgi:hypothetical protein
VLLSSWRTHSTIIGLSILTSDITLYGNPARTDLSNWPTFLPLKWWWISWRKRCLETSMKNICKGWAWVSGGIHQISGGTVVNSTLPLLLRFLPLQQRFYLENWYVVPKRGLMRLFRSLCWVGVLERQLRCLNSSCLATALPNYADTTWTLRGHYVDTAWPLRGPKLPTFLML